MSYKNFETMSAFLFKPFCKWTLQHVLKYYFAGCIFILGKLHYVKCTTGGFISLSVHSEIVGVA